MSIELIQPYWLLSLLPFALYWWWLRYRQRSKVSPIPVAQVEIWKRLSTPTEVRTKLLPLCIGFFLILLSAGPRVVPLPENEIGWSRDFNGFIHLDVKTPPQGPLSLLDTGSPVNANYVSSASGAVTISFLELPPETLLNLKGSNNSLELKVPPRPDPIRVFQLGEQPGVNEVLTALEEQNWITRVDAAQRYTAEVEIGPARSVRNRHVGFVSDGPEVWLPSMRAAKLDDPLLRGLQPEQWTISSSYQTATGTPILTGSKGEALVTRTADGFLWGFSPTGGDLSERSDWPLLLTRMLIELGEASRSRIDSQTWAGLHLPFLFTSILLVLLPVLLGSGSKWSAAVLFIALLGSLTQHEYRLPEKTSQTSSYVLWAKSLPAGSVIQIPRQEVAPPPEFFEALRTRGMGWKFSGQQTPQWSLSKNSCRPGEVIHIVHLQDSDVSGWTQKNPRGSISPLTLPLTPEFSGLWTIIDSQGVEAPLLVLPSFPVSIAEKTSDGLGQLFEEPTFKSSTISLPTPPLGGLYAWQGQELSSERIEEIDKWVRSGGILFASVGSPGCEDEETRNSLSNILGVNLPEPPPEGDLDMGLLLIDLSGSLLGSAATTLLESTLILLESGDGNTRWGLAGFRDELNWILEPGTSISANTLEQIPELIRSGGGTRLGQAIRKVLPVLKNHSGQRRVVLITDGKTTPDRWSDLGKDLALAEVELEVLLVGNKTDTSVVSQLTRASGGRWQEAANPTEAQEILKTLLEENPAGWKKTTSPLIQDLSSVFLSGYTDPVGIPYQSLTPDSTARIGTAELVWIDAQRRPLLTLQRVELGLAVTWWSGLDPLRLGPSGPRIKARLRELLVSALERNSTSLRQGALTQSASGKRVFMMERRPGDGLEMEQGFDSSTLSDQSLLLSAEPGSTMFKGELPDHILDPVIYQQSPIDSERSFVVSESSLENLALMKWVDLPPKGKQAMGFQPHSFLLFLAAIILISSPVRQRSGLGREQR